jgi:hypothetical protein
MISVPEDDGCAEIVPKIALRETFDSRLSTHRHEGRSWDVAVVSVQNAGPGVRLRAFGKKLKCNLTSQASSVLWGELQLATGFSPAALLKTGDKRRHDCRRGTHECARHKRCPIHVRSFFSTIRYRAFPASR